MSMAGVSAFIAIPAYSWTVYLPTMRSLFSDMTALMRSGATVSVYDESGSTDLPEARALIVSEFLASGASHLVCVDNDVCWEAGAIPKLIGHGQDFVAGIYPQRKDPIEWPVKFLDGCAACLEAGDLLEVEAVPAGFMVLTRQCLIDMSERYADLAYRSPRQGGKTLIGLFDPLTIDGARMGEDYSFCKRWRDMGGKIYADTKIKMGHAGPKLFMGRLSDAIHQS